jgi:uncharacterized protein YjbI with pentapeptide repeats
MSTFEKQTFEFFDDFETGKTFSDLAFVKCHFIGCAFSSTQEVKSRSIARNIEFIDCEITGGFIGPGIVEEVLIHGLKVRNHFQTFGTVFKHVTVKGKINKLMLTPYIDLSGCFPDVQEAFNRSNQAYYKDVDWAVDISEADFTDCDLRGIPSRLIRRDKETQVVIKRDKVIRAEWRKIDLSNTYWKVAIEKFLKDEFEDCVLVAPKKSSEFKVLLDGLNKLRDFGVAEID